jgi:hypothetical protein
MKLVTLIKATKTKESNWVEPRGIQQGVLDMPIPGFLRTAHLGSAGLTFKRGEVVVGITREALFKLAEELDPAFIPPTAAVVAATPAALAKLQ